MPLGTRIWLLEIAIITVSVADSRIRKNSNANYFWIQSKINLNKNHKNTDNSSPSWMSRGACHSWKDYLFNSFWIQLVIAWIWNVLQRHRSWRLGLEPLVLGEGGTFRRWSLGGGSWVTGACPERGYHFLLLFAISWLPRFWENN